MTYVFQAITADAVSTPVAVQLLPVRLSPFPTLTTEQKPVCTCDCQLERAGWVVPDFGEMNATGGLGVTMEGSRACCKSGAALP